MKRGAISGTLCGIGVVVCMIGFFQTSFSTGAILSAAGAYLFAIGSMMLAIQAWD